jgi:ATP-dependent protease ClpP protease subunit
MCAILIILSYGRRINLSVPNQQEPPIPQVTDTVYISYFGTIDDRRVQSLMDVCSNIVARQGPNTIYFLFSSTGGGVNAGLTLYNFLRALPVEITMHNIGSIDSIAAIIFLAASKRYAAKHSSFLFHGISWNFAAKASMSFYQINENLSRICQEEARVAAIIAERTKMTEAAIRDLFRQGECKNLDFAMANGIIDEIREPAIPKNAPVVTVDPT